MTAAALGIHMEVEPQSAQEVAELADACSTMWGKALGVYYSDAQAAWKGIKYPPDGGEALNDLLGSRELLRNLLDHFAADMNPDRLGDAMLDGIEAGLNFKPAGMTRPVPEVVEDYVGCRPPKWV